MQLIEYDDHLGRHYTLVNGKTAVAHTAVHDGTGNLDYSSDLQEALEKLRVLKIRIDAHTHEPAGPSEVVMTQAFEEEDQHPIAPTELTTWLEDFDLT